MRIYLDDDVASALLARLFHRAGHDIRLPSEIQMSGEDDSVHLTQAVREHRTILSGNHDDFEKLHYLVVESGGHHPGILIVRRDNDPNRDLSPRGIVTAVRNLEATRVPLENCFYVLNRWR
jgi:hypothetical protein